MKVVQLNEDGCLSYLLYCPNTSEAVVLDPTYPVEKILEAIEERSLQVKYIIETHTHADHASSAGELGDTLNAKVVMHENIKGRLEVTFASNIPTSIVKIINNNSKIKIDLTVTDNNKLMLGNEEIAFIATPGHTVDGMCVMVKHLLFTGDTLLVGQCGRTDLPGGSGTELFNSIYHKLLLLPESTVIYPAHDYEGNINTALGYEKANNIFLNKESEGQFVNFLQSFFPPMEADNGEKLQCSIAKSGRVAPGGPTASAVMSELCFHMEKYLRLAPKDWNVITNEVLLEQLVQKQQVLIIDVREPEELGITGYIQGAVNIPLRQLPENMQLIPVNKEQLIVVVCRSGVRSAYGALYIRGYGYSNVKNLEYGMQGWLKNNYPVIFLENNVGNN